MRARTLALGAGLALALAAPAAAAPGTAAVRAATAGYHDLAAAEADGYGLFTDAAGIACIDKPGEGGMGVHYVKGSIVTDGAVDARTPEALVYEPQPNGRLRLVAVEYVVFQDAWDAKHDDPPELFGEDFEPMDATNRYGLDPFYELHVWLWKFNPEGLFEDWNPRVFC
jgi:hypothetical protein